MRKMKNKVVSYTMLFLMIISSALALLKEEEVTQSTIPISSVIILSFIVYLIYQKNN